MVSTASRMVRAISLGVFWRLAPSTRVIMRSRKVWPRSAVMRTTMRSERTLVPPVTAERSPPDSRMTGADSPVMADSSTEAMPSMISPSEGMRSPASHTTRSPLASAAAGTSSSVPSASRRRASVSDRIRRSVSAWALPRPSAMASAKLAKITVRNSQMVMDQVKMPGWAMASMKVIDRADQHHEHDRVLDLHAGVQLLEGVDERLAAGSRGRRGPGPRPRRGPRSTVPDWLAAGWWSWSSEELSVAELLDDRAERDGGEEGEAADDDDHADGQADEHARCRCGTCRATRAPRSWPPAHRPGPGPGS